MPINAVITGTGSFLPGKRMPNEAFVEHTFYKPNGELVTKPSSEVVQKLREISGIYERRYIEDHHDSADLGAFASEKAIESAGIDKESIDEIIVAHNFGNMVHGDRAHHLIPNLAALIKNRLGIQNPDCTAYDVLYGCPGWLLAMHMANQSIATGYSKRVLVVGVEVITRILDPHDLDSMLFGDGAGAVIVDAVEEEEKRGILYYKSVSHCEEEVEYLEMGTSYNPDSTIGTTVKMRGRNVYKYAVNEVPKVITDCLNKVGIGLKDVAKLLPHQANEKMLMAIGEKLFKQHNLVDVDLSACIPISLRELGNASVATIPTLLDMILRGDMPEHALHEGDTVVMASVGAGMHTNGLVYRF